MARTVPDRSSPHRLRVPDPGLAVTAVGAAVVTVVCAVASYTHIQHLAESAGQGELAGWLPLGVDGLVASSTASLLVDRRAGRPAGLSAKLGLVLGLTGSLAANLVAVDPTLVSERAVRLALAGYPPVALALAGHVLLTMLLGAPATKAVESRRGKAGQNRAGLRPGEVGATPAASPPERKKARPEPDPPVVRRVPAGTPIVPEGYDSPEPAVERRPATVDDARRVAAALTGDVSLRKLRQALRDDGLSVSNDRAKDLHEALEVVA